MGLSDRSFLKRRVGKPDSRARGGIHTWFGRFVLACFFSPHLRRLREFVWVGGCVTVPVAWASGPSALASRGPWGRRCRGARGPARPCGWPWGRRSVHRLAKMASRRRSGPFVYTVAPRAAMRVATRAAGRCRARHRSAGLRRSAFQMNGKRLMGDSSRSCTPRRVCPIRFKALTHQSSLHTGFSALCLPAWQMA